MLLHQSFVTMAFLLFDLIDFVFCSEYSLLPFSSSFVVIAVGHILWPALVNEMQYKIRSNEYSSTDYYGDQSSHCLSFGSTVLVNSKFIRLQFHLDFDRRLQEHLTPYSQPWFLPQLQHLRP
mmetsp:Transcript_8597/g.15049  ORF Transcript_8597/g.15049 Transcript_8597/m.15049 type:complete len:122 (+) Transcript_8597:222-587(+)